MTNYILSIDENSKRGKLIKLLLSELSSKKEAQVMTLEEFEKTEDKIIARQIRRGKKGASYSLAEAKIELLKLERKTAL